MERHCDNAERIAAWLLEHPRCAPCSTPACPNTPAMRSPPPDAPLRRMVSFRLVGGEEDALNVCKRTEVFTLGESLGGVESLVEHPGG